MQIAPPFGYGNIIPLEKHHKVLLPHLPAAGGGAVPAFAGSMNAMTISFSEFPPAARDYPIVFAPLEGGGYTALAVLGLAEHHNLYVEAGQWVPGSYVPAFVRRFPFCLSRLVLDGIAQAEKLVCIDSAYIDESGVALFTADGVPSARWTERQQLLADYEADLELGAQMCAGLEKLDLLEPFTMQITEGARMQFQMQGMFRVNETKFIDLKAASHKALVRKGWAARVYAHLFSLNNFSRLHERAQALEAAERIARRN